MSIIDEFIEGVVLSLPDEGLEKLNELLDEGNFTEGKLSALLQEYDVNPLEILKERRSKEETL